MHLNPPFFAKSQLFHSLNHFVNMRNISIMQGIAG